MKLEQKILGGFGAGVVLGALSRMNGLTPLRDLLVALDPIGTIFIRLVTMVVVPLVIASVFVGVASLGDVRTLGRIGGRTLAYFLATTFAAAIIGIVVASATGVGQGLSVVDRDALVSALADSAARASLRTAAPPTMLQTLINIVPQNPFASAAQGGGDLLPLIVAVVIFGAAATVTTSDAQRTVLRFFEGVNAISMVVIGWFMKLAPVAVFALIASTVARSGASLLTALLAFSLTVLLALAVHSALILMPVLRFGTDVGFRAFFRATSDALLLAFSTASSNATLPVSMSAAEERLAIPRDITAFVLPSGASMNKNGSAAYKAVAAVFIAHLYGMAVTPAVMVTIVLMSTIAAFAGAGIPGSSLITTLIVLNAIGLGSFAASGIALVAAVDRPLDMCRSAVNTFSNLVGSAWVARTTQRI